MRFVQVLDDVVELVQRVGALRLSGPACDRVAQVTEAAQIRARALVHALVVAAAAMGLVQQASVGRVLRQRSARQEEHKKAKKADSHGIYPKPRAGRW